MGRVLLTIPENVATFLKVGSSFRVEFFKVSTFATSGTTGVTVAVDDASGFAVGDHIYIGTNSKLTTEAPIVITGISSNNITVGQSFTWANNDSVILKRDVKADASNDNYATFYDDPDFATAFTGGQPISVDSDNQVFGFMPPGRYGMRWSTTAATVEAHHHITFDEVGWVQVTNSDSPTSGIQEAINALPAGGGTVYLPAGTYSISTQINIGVDNTRIIGQGQDLSIIQQAASSDLTGILVASGALDDIEIAHIGIDGSAANQSASATTIGMAFAQASNRLHIHDCRIVNINKDGISVGQVTPNSQEVRIIGNDLQQIGRQGIALTYCEGFEVRGNQLNRLGSHAIGIVKGVAASSSGRITDNFVDRDSAPTVVFDSGTESGDLISIGAQTTDLVVGNNVLIGNVDRSGSVTAGDGIGLTQTASTEHERITITGNVVRKTSGAGIEVPNNSIVSNNVVQLTGTHGITFLFGETTVISNAIVCDNIIEDCDETDVGSIAGIHLDVTGAASSSANNVTIRGNIVRDTRGTKQTASGLTLTSDGTRAITNLIVEGNNLKDVLTQTVTWGGTNFTSIRFRNNITIASEYSGETTLVAGTKAVQNTDWPAVAGLRFVVSRTSIGSTGAAGLGILNALFDGTDTVTISAFDPADATDPLDSDVSDVFWEFIGTAT